MPSSDSFFSIGTSHKICQDYAIAGAVKGTPFVAISDGCSSSPHTDFGSRFLCLAVQESLQLLNTMNQEAILPMACASVGKLLPWECLDATLFTVYEDHNHDLDARLSGDGVMVARRKDGCFTVWDIEFNHNAPAYLSYQLNRQRLTTYLSGKLSIGVVGDQCGIRTIKRSTYSKEFLKLEWTNAVHTQEVVVGNPSTFWFSYLFGIDNVDTVAIFSDGVHSFQRKNFLGHLESIPLEEVLRQLMAFKGMKGEFVTRRCHKFFNKFCVENGWSHYDDFSMAAIYVGGD